MTDGTDTSRHAVRLITEPTTVADAIVRVLEEAGIDMVFGIPGGNMGPSLYDALYDHSSTIRSVLVREESLASIMAEVYGRLTRRPGVVIAQGLWLLSNAAIGALEGYMSSSPMLLLGDLSEGGTLSHHAPYQCGTGEYGAWDARKSFEGFTKQTIVPASPVQAVQQTQLAIKHAMSGQPGPVAMLFPERSVMGEIDADTTPRLYSTAPYLYQAKASAHAGDVENAVGLLRAAKRPVIIAGNGVRLSDAYAELHAVADAFAIPVATTAGGKSAIAENDALALGACGVFGTPVANSTVGEADVILVVGSKLGPTDTANENPELIDPERQALIQIDVEPRNAAWTFPVEHVLVGDAKVVLQQLVDAAGSDLPSRDDWWGSIGAAKEALGFFDDAERTSDASPVLPQRIINEIQLGVDDDAIICCDAGENRIFMTHHFQTKAPGTFIQSAGIGAMGYAIPAALAAKLVHPDRQVLAVCGDGGFGMTMNGLMTAREENIPIVCVVFNNSALGWVKHEQEEHDREISCDFASYDHAAIARAMGCEGIRVDNSEDLAGALQKALASGRPTVVDVSTSLSESYKRVTSPLATVVA